MAVRAILQLDWRSLGDETSIKKGERKDVYYAVYVAMIKLSSIAAK